MRLQRTGHDAKYSIGSVLAVLLSEFLNHLSYVGAVSNHYVAYRVVLKGVLNSEAHGDIVA